MSTAYFNARNIVNTFDEIEVVVHNEEPDIIGVSETWLHADILYSESELKGYCMYRGDGTHRRGEGCLLYIKETIKTKEVVIEGQDRTETVWAAIINGNKEEAVLGVVYRRPGISVEDDNDLHQTIGLARGRATSGPRARSGPRRSTVRPATLLCNNIAIRPAKPQPTMPVS